MSRIWAGTDCGKTRQHCVDADGRRLLSRRAANDEPELLDLVSDVLPPADGTPVTWALDMTGGEPALLIALLTSHCQELLYVPGRVVNRASGAYRGEGKTDARDALVIADQARMRRDVQPVRPGNEASIVLELLIGRRIDLVTERTRVVNRLRSTLNCLFPALERALGLLNVGPLVLLSTYQTPAAVRRVGASCLTTWLKNRKIRGAASPAAAAVKAAERQHTAVTGKAAVAMMVRTPANDVAELNEKIAELDQRIEERLRQHQPAEVITSVPGIGPTPGAEFLAAVGNDLSAFPNPDPLAAFVGLAPAPHGSGKTTGNPCRPLRYHRRLQHVFYQSALISIRTDPNSRAFYDRKRAEGKRHVQAVIALAPRRANVFWALIRDRRYYQVAPPEPATT